MKNNHEKYLERYAEPIAQDLVAKGHFPKNKWGSVLVIPCYAEIDLLQSCLESIESAAAKQTRRPLIIIVINRKSSDTEEVIEQTQKCLDLFDDLPSTKISNQLTLVKSKSFDSLVIDYARAYTFDDRQGVGLARKIGCDCAVALIYRNKIDCSWILTSDVDVKFPDDFFEPIGSCNAAAINLNFRHIPIDTSNYSWQALQLYEVSLRYYVLGLHYARSPYCYHSIGSTLCINSSAYVSVRGFPKRLAGEDFHILCKLSKVGAIKRSLGKEVLIKDRPSTRVPFGTGVAVDKMITTPRLLAQHTFYHHHCFEALRQWLDKVPLLFDSSTNLKTIFSKQDNKLLTQEVIFTLDKQLGLRSGLSAIKCKSKTQESFRKHFNIWFDALKTLRFIHILRDQLFQNLPAITALTNAPFLSDVNISDVDSIEDIFNKVRALEYEIFARL